MEQGEEGIQVSSAGELHFLDKKASFVEYRCKRAQILSFRPLAPRMCTRKNILLEIAWQHLKQLK
jgi:hypothetical protein